MTIKEMLGERLYPLFRDGLIAVPHLFEDEGGFKHLYFVNSWGVCYDKYYFARMHEMSDREYSYFFRNADEELFKKEGYGIRMPRAWYDLVEYDFDPAEFGL